MAHLTTSVEYGIHCLMWLARAEAPLSSRDLAELQGVSPSFVAKIFPRLEKAGIVASSEGIRGGYRLARPAEDISFLEIVDAIEGEKPLFECKQVRSRCAVFGGAAPDWSTDGICSIHAVMLQAEKSMRDALARQSLASVQAAVDRKSPLEFHEQVDDWLSHRLQTRRPGARARTGEPPG
jgi:Rrf2 family protein